MLISYFRFPFLPRKVTEVQFYLGVLHDKRIFKKKLHGFPVSYGLFMLKNDSLGKREGVAITASYTSTFNSAVLPLVRRSSVLRMNADN